MADSIKQPTMGKERPIENDDQGTPLLKLDSPHSLLLLVTLTALLSEIVGYFLVDTWNFPSSMETVLLDAMVTTAFVFGVVYFLVFKRMRSQVRQLQRLEKSLRQREADYRGIVEDQTELICWITPQGKVSFINNAIAKYLADPAATLLGEDYLSWFFPEDGPNIQAQMSRLTPDHPIATGEYRQNIPGGILRWFSWTVRAIYHPEGELIHYQAVGRDTTDYHTAMEALQEARNGLEVKVQQRTLEMARINRELRAEIGTRKKNEDLIKMQSTALEAAADGIMITDPKGTILWGNPALAALTGYPLTELIGQTPALFNSGTHPAEFYATLWNTILSGGVWRGETNNRRKDATQYVEEQTITPVWDKSGHISNFIAIKHDITERKSDEEQLSRRNWELQALNSVGNSVSPSLDINWRLSFVKQLLAQEMSVPSGAVYSYDPDLDRFRLETAWESPAHTPGLPGFLPIDHSRVLEEKKPFLIPPAQTGQGDVLCIPLLSQGQVQGVIDLSIQGSKIGIAERFEFLESLGNQIGVAIHNARLYKAEKQARQTAEVMRDASLALSQTLDLNTVLRTLMDSVSHLVPNAERISLFTLEDGWLKPIAAGGFEPSSTLVDADLMNVHDFPLIWEIVESQAPKLIEDTEGNSLWRPILSRSTTHCWLGVPIRVAGEIKGICCLESDHPSCFTQYHIGTTQALLGEAAVAIQNARLYEEIHSGRERLQALSRRLVEVQEMERRYIARELHDDTSQALIGLVFALEIIKRDAGNPEAVAAGVAELDRIIAEILDNLHHLAVDLRPTALDHLGLIPAVRQYIDGISEKHLLPIQLDVPQLTSRLPGDIETALYRIIQEALANVVRHAKATQANVRIAVEDGYVRAFVSDDGVGFNVDEALANQRLGLFGMRERAEMLNGSFTIISEPGCGTRISMEIPYDISNTDRG